MLHAAAYPATLQKLEAESIFPATRNAILRCEEGVLHLQFVPQLVSQRRCVANGRKILHRVTESLDN